MITASNVQVRIGARELLSGATFRINAGDRIGLVGRNGAGKTTLTKILAGQAQATDGAIHTAGDVGYLPQDPRTGDLDVLARDRVLSARRLDEVIRRIRRAEEQMATGTDAVREKAMNTYARLDGRWVITRTGYTRNYEAMISLKDVPSFRLNDNHLAPADEQ